MFAKILFFITSFIFLNITHAESPVLKRTKFCSAIAKVAEKSYFEKTNNKSLEIIMNEILARTDQMKTQHITMIKFAIYTGYQSMAVEEASAKAYSYCLDHTRINKKKKFNDQI
jgi:hypothetical protein